MEPDTNSDQRSVIPASDILAKIKRGEPVEYDDVIVEGDLYLSLVLPTEHVERTEYEIKELGLTEVVRVVKSPISIRNSELRGTVKFSKVIFQKLVDFSGTNFSADADFSIEVKFDSDANFMNAVFGGKTLFNGAKFGRFANFEEADFDSDANFMYAKFGGETLFGDAKFGRFASFYKAQFSGDADFLRAQFSGDAGFGWAQFSGDADFRGAQFNGGLSFEETVFNRPGSQEVACRIAKRKMEELGNKKKADDYFYREMVAIRIQKGRWGVSQSPSNIRERLRLIGAKVFRFLKHDFLEYVFVQGIFGYGVYPFRVIGTWLVMVFVFAFIYCVGKGVTGADTIYECVWFSIATAATPGYAMFRPNGFYQLVSGIEAILGTFLWAAFIATFARKWMR